MGKERLGSELDLVRSEELNLLEARRVRKIALGQFQEQLDIAERDLSVAEKVWREAEDRRDFELAAITHWNEQIAELEARRAIIERRLFEARVDEMAKEGP